MKNHKLKLSKNEINKLINCLWNARLQGVDSPETFMDFLNTHSLLLLLYARENEDKAKDTKIRDSVRQHYFNVSKRCRKESRITRRIHTKIKEHRKGSVRQ